MTALNDAYINALLADASYVDRLETSEANERLAARLTQALADFITTNFEVLDQSPTNDGFSAVVWKGKVGTEYAGQTYVSMRGTYGLQDNLDDAQLAATGVSYSQLRDMVNWWLRETTPAGQMAMQIDFTTTTVVTPSPLPPFLPLITFDNNFVSAPSVLASGGALKGMTAVDFVNGHSLGGYLSTAFERIFGNVGHLSTFNSAGFTQFQTQNINDAFSQIAAAIDGSLVRTGFANNLQTNYFAENGINVTTNTWDSSLGFNQIGQRVPIFQEDKTTVGDPIYFGNHYMYKLTDVLALGDAISKLDNSFSVSQLNDFVKKSSNNMDASYEKLLDGLRQTILGGTITDTLIGDASNGTDPGEPASRIDYHNNLKVLTDSAAFQSLIGKVTLVAPPTSASEARDDFGAFLSLHYLSPFALKPINLSAASILKNINATNADLALKWAEDSTRTPEQIANGEANFSDTYLNDRAEMLSWKLKYDGGERDFNDFLTVGDKQYDEEWDAHVSSDRVGYVQGDWDYIDYSIRINNSPIKLSIDGRGTDTNHQIVFGSKNANTITGGTNSDRLYGGGGDDSIDGGEGNDYIEGGAGKQPANNIPHKPHGYWLAEHVITYLNQDKLVLFDLNTHKTAANDKVNSAAGEREAALGYNEWRVAA